MKTKYLTAFLVSSSVFAQQSMECELMQQRVSGRASEPKLCLAIYQQCSENAIHASNVQAAQTQCSAGLGKCQMGGALSGESLQQAIDQYKKVCGRSIKKPPELSDGAKSVSAQ